MFISYSSYYLKSFRIRYVPFLEITNYTDLQIYFILQYDTLSGRKTKQSPAFGRNASHRIFFTMNAQNIAFNVINASSPTFDLICNRMLSVAKNYHFYVIETPTGFDCVEA